MTDLLSDLLRSWNARNGLHATESLLQWIRDQNSTSIVEISRIALKDAGNWYYDDASGAIVNRNHGFFRIKGIQQRSRGNILLEQPIILQEEIGFLGIICRKIDGILHLFMQAKIEPGNINRIQLSPTIQATKSNFTMVHGGARPAFLEHFANARPNQIIVDQIQSEQSSRFYKKRNRNMMLVTDAPLEESSTHKWMTLGQIKSLMRYDNIVNMDTRTVISCIPFSFLMEGKEEVDFTEFGCVDIPMVRSMTARLDQRVLTRTFHAINRYKQFSMLGTNFVDLYALDTWGMHEDVFSCSSPYPFRVIFCDISIEGREVKHWTQPLFEATGIATFGLVTRVENGKKEFLVHLKPEIGCFDGIELGPSVQQEYGSVLEPDSVSELFFGKVEAGSGIVLDVLLSEEGGRFYHEQNRNVIVEIEKDELGDLPEGYFWMDYRNLNMFTQFNNCVNIQLRNLMSLLEV